MKPLKAPGLILLAFSGILTWNACIHDPEPIVVPDPNDAGPACAFPAANLSYTNSIKAIVDVWCLGCHGGSGPGTGDFRSYSGMKATLENGVMLQKVVIDKTMPEGGGLTELQRDSINCWLKSGFPE